MKKILALILSLAMLTAMAVSLASCTEEESVDVGIVLPTKEEPRWLQDEASFKEALDKAGFSSEVLFENFDRSFVTRGLLGRPCGIDVNVIEIDNGKVCLYAHEASLLVVII